MPNTRGPTPVAVSPKALADAGINYALLLGHIERRKLFNETDDLVNRKVIATLQAGMTRLARTDETMIQKEFSGSVHYVFEQLINVLRGVSRPGKNIIISYE